MPVELNAKKNEQLKRVKLLAKDLGVEILAHFYQRAEVKAAAHFVGGSYKITARALQSRAKAVMACGASFLTETIRRERLKAELLTPRDDLSCPLAEAVSPADLEAAKQLYPEALVVVDMKAKPKIRAAADIEISPANAREILKGLGQKEIIALPGPQLVQWAGFGHLIVSPWPQAVCQAHETALPEDLEKARKAFPTAKIAANFLCRPEIKSRADFIGDSQGIKFFCENSPAKEFIIISEAGLAEYLSEIMPKFFHETEAEIFCPNMKLTTLKSMINRLELFAGKKQWP